MDYKQMYEQMKEENKELKEEMKWRMWGENMKGADYDIENDEDAWDCVVMEHGFTETEMKQLLKYYPRPVLSDSDTEDEVRGVCYSCEKEGKFIGKEGDDWLCEECC